MKTLFAFVCSIIFISTNFFCLNSPVLYGQEYEKSLVSKDVAIELDAVQTKKGTFIASVMYTDKSEDLRDCQVKFYRSSNNGKSWDSVYSVLAEDIYLRNADPFMSIDSEGNIYVIIMRLPQGFISHLWVYKSTDDGLSWEVAGKPVTGSSFADYAHVLGGNPGEVFAAYTEYNPSPSLIYFTNSTDYAQTWTTPKILIKFSGNFAAVGSDIRWLKGNKIGIAFGDYNHQSTYFTYSNDFGKTWEKLVDLPTITYTVNKVIANKDFEHLGVISHNPHKQNSQIFFSFTDDVNSTWTTKIIENSAAYCEGIIDNNGNYHIVYNDFDNGQSHLTYTYSTDKGKTFYNTQRLFSSSYNGSSNVGEYQSLILGSDNKIYLTYVDWSDKSSVSQIVFPPMLTNITPDKENDNAPMIFPNPADDYIRIKNINDGENCNVEIYSVDGKLVIQSNFVNSDNSINLEKLIPGAYLIQIKLNNQTFIEKFIKK